MTRRSTPAAKTDDARFPVRIKFAVPDTGLGRDIDRVHEWLTENVGKDHFAVHSAPTIGGSAIAVHLVCVGDSQQLVDAFPQLVLANSQAY